MASGTPRSNATSKGDEITEQGVMAQRQETQRQPDSPTQSPLTEAEVNRKNADEGSQPIRLKISGQSGSSQGTPEKKNVKTTEELAKIGVSTSEMASSDDEKDKHALITEKEEHEKMRNNIEGLKKREEEMRKEIDEIKEAAKNTNEEEKQRGA